MDERCRIGLYARNFRLSSQTLVPWLDLAVLQRTASTNAACFARRTIEHSCRRSASLIISALFALPIRPNSQIRPSRGTYLRHIIENAFYPTFKECIVGSDLVIIIITLLVVIWLIN
jgi:hypothetical protein